MVEPLEPLKLKGSYYYYKESIDKQRGISFWYKDRWYKNIYDVAERHNMPTSVALARLELAWSIEDIIRRPWDKR